MQIACAKTTEEFERIFHFRYAIYIEEMGKPMPGADHERRELRDELDGRATQLYIEREGEIAGTVRIVWGADGIPANFADWYGLNQPRFFHNFLTIISRSNDNSVRKTGQSEADETTH